MFLSHGLSKWLQNKLPFIFFKTRAIYFCIDICKLKLFSWWIRFYSVYVPHFPYPFFSWWTPALIPLPFAVNNHEYGWAIAMQRLPHEAKWRVLRGHALQWNSWLTQPSISNFEEMPYWLPQMPNQFSLSPPKSGTLCPDIVAWICCHMIFW